ncbi:MAG TPA: 23S rRNA (uracil(1939)-C(5))-methyltransferase RlmD [[Clostridium] spiroforme]|uniref:23S rRNA (Uracil(1939)-C(5))-methyltransferase RlmD n=1 Tax=Thomasclavelia spiroformis TaxID=29348 RepID=A0A921GBD9_9FIRM|nr:23S rRNA (uracil(1939)-C(5))-methyltransferase RlmD [Thomasclavelia spiroformis]
MKKNDYFYGECIDLTHDGQGVVKVDNFTYFVKGMLVGETGKLKVIKVLKNYAIARLIELDNVSKYRVEPKCPVFKPCGGCQLQHLNQEGQMLFKTKRVKDCLERIGNCFVEVNDCLMMEDPWYYRNKVQMPIGVKGNRLVTGFYKQKSNEIIPCDECFIQNKLSNQITKRVKELMEKYKIYPYDKLSHQGNIKHILTKHGYHSNEIMLVLISYLDKINNVDKLVAEITKEFPMIKTVIQNINHRIDNVILGDKEIILFGDGFIYDNLLDNRYKISLKSFYQINPIQVEKLYQKAIEFAKLSNDDVVLDAYCGIGTISLSLAQYVHKVYGVEIVEQAIIDAKENAKRNHIDNVEFYCQDAGEFMVDFATKHKQIDAVIVDPPRKGCSQLFLNQLLLLSPDKIVYISCDVATQARDIDILQQHGYHAVKCQPVDMFPQSFHIENIVLLTK